ncbi:hypothetical protein EDB83DRAFT_1296462 [Lactarius deliciosus]|nr:hypothetical protein EDB83DRAFT_1296462 [Lactarius deliciosus]
MVRGVIIVHDAHSFCCQGPSQKPVTIDKLPEDVLLEIFGAYRQDMELQPRYEKVWNSRNGWFKLAHVCRSWRRVVLSSPFHLHVHLLFTPRRSSRAGVLSRLPPLPILIDYCAASWTGREVNPAVVAIRHRSRVRGIAFRRSYTDTTAKLLRSLSHPFPKLESLEIYPTYGWCSQGLILPTTFLSGSASCLRRLTLRDVVPRSLSPLLSSATGLVELALTLRVVYGALPEASFIASLQRMSCLRRLELDLHCRPNDIPSEFGPPPPASAGEVVPLSKLTHLIFTGYRLYLQALVVRLAAPTLQHLNVTLYGQSFHFFPISHLCKFIRDTGCQFTTVHLCRSRLKLKFCAGTGPQSVDDQPFRIIIPVPVSLVQMGQELSGPLSTVEKVIITWDVESSSTGTVGHVEPDQWRGFFSHVPQVKMVRVPAKAALDVAHSFQQGGEPVLDLLPALERVKVLSTVGRDNVYVSGCDAFEPLIAARQRAGRPIRLSWIFG